MLKDFPGGERPGRSSIQSQLFYPNATRGNGAGCRCYPRLLVFELSAKHFKHMLQRIVFKVGLVEKLSRRI